jgi:hypothetical protein
LKAYWPALLFVVCAGACAAVLAGCERAEPTRGRRALRASSERHEGRDAVSAPCLGKELELALKLGLSARVCRVAEPGRAELAVAAPRVEASAVAPGFWPAGPTFRVATPGALAVGYATERYTLRPGHRPVLIALEPTGPVVHAARFEAQRFSADLTSAPRGRLQFGLLPGAGVTSGSGARSAAP